jgi:uncharacterized membrane protein
MAMTARDCTNRFRREFCVACDGSYFVVVVVVLAVFVLVFILILIILLLLRDQDLPSRSLPRNLDEGS